MPKKKKMVRQISSKMNFINYHGKYINIKCLKRKILQNQND